MAIGKAFQSVNMNGGAIWEVDDAPVMSGTHLRITNLDGERQDFFGSGFEYFVDPLLGPIVVAGTIEEIAYQESGTPIYEISGLDHSAVEAYNLFVAGDNRDFLEFFFEGNDKLGGSGQNDTLNGYTGADVIDGNGGADKLNGGIGADKLIGGAGKDMLTGGTGADKFVFDEKATNASFDTITDFVHNSDRIQLDNADFAKVGEAGALLAKAFWVGSAAHDASDRIIYDKVSGYVYYDPDGTGAAAQVKVALLTGSPDNVSVADFQVI